MARSVASILAALLLGLLAAATAASAAASPVVGGFSARVVDDEGRPMSATYLERTVSAGAGFTGRMLVSNQSDRPVRLRVYPVDGLTGATTGTVYANRENARRETGRWLTPAVSKLTLAAGSTRLITVRVAVPADARPGDHVGAVVFERPPASKRGGNFSIKEVVRVAIAVHLRVRGEAHRTMGLGSVALKALPGTQAPSVVVGLRNTGELLCKPNLEVMLHEGGRRVGAERRQLDTVLAGDDISYPMPWPTPLGAGTYEATATVTGCGTPSTRRTTVTLADDLLSTPARPEATAPATDDDSGGGVPTWAVVAIAAAALIVGFLLARRRPREDRSQPSES